MIVRVWRDLGKWAFVYEVYIHTDRQTDRHTHTHTQVQDEAGNDGMVELRADGKSLLMCGKEMAERMGGQRATQAIERGVCCMCVCVCVCVCVSTCVCLCVYEYVCIHT